MDVEFVDVEFELVELPVAFPLEAGEFPVRVNVTGMALETITVFRFWSSETPVENEVNTVTWAVAAEVALSLFYHVTWSRVVRLERECR